MTVEIEYDNVLVDKANLNQLKMAEQIESNRGFPISDITRVIRGNTFIVRVETNLPNSAVDNMLSDIEEYLNAEANHVETREV